MADENSDLIEYALGVLPADQAEQIARKLATDPAMRAELQSIEDTLNGITDNQTPLPKPPKALRDRILNTIRNETRYDGFVDRLCEMYQLGVEQINDILSKINDIGGESWEKMPFAGVQLLHFEGGPRVANADCGLVYLAPGTTFPTHRHGGDEWSLVLQGEVEDNGEKIYYPGDLVHLAAGSAHHFRALGDKPLILAVVLFDGFEMLESP